MQKLDWYIIKKFLGTFFFSVTLILLIVVVFDISEKIDDFIEKGPLNAILFKYYLNFIPYFEIYLVHFSLLPSYFSLQKWPVILKSFLSLAVV